MGIHLLVKSFWQGGRSARSCFPLDLPWASRGREGVSGPVA